MSERPKIHVFLGAPPPSSAPAVVPEAREEEEFCPPANWRHLELTWKEGRLQPAADDGDEVRSSRAKSEDEEADRSKKDILPQKTLTDCEDNWTTERRQGCRIRAEELASDKKDLRTEEEPYPTEEDQCSASVDEYLDSCFPAAQPDLRKPHPGPGPSSEHPSEKQPSATIPHLSTHTQYLCTWTLSQALILKGHGIKLVSSPEKTPSKHNQEPPSVSSSSPELFSPMTPSPTASAELFSHPCLTQRAEKEGIVLEATTDGIFFSQKPITAHGSPTKSPSSKKARVSEESRTTAPEHTTRAGVQSRTTLLDRCDRAGLRYSVLVVVVHPCHLKEVKVRSGMSAGTFVPLASIVVMDQSGLEMKVVLWQRAAFWSLTVSPGDILLITGLQVREDRWRGEMALQSTFSSKLLHLGHASTSPPVTRHADARSVSSLYEFIRERRPLLASLPRPPPQDLNRLPYTNLRTLRVNTLVHALLRVTHTRITADWRSEATSYSRSAVQQKVVLTVEQPDGQQGALLLWGAAVDWLPRFNADRTAVWDFHVLLVREGLTSDLLELHSTPWSSIRILAPSDRRILDFQRTQCRQRRDGGAVELDVDTLLSQKYSGEVELSVHVMTFNFQGTLPSQNAFPQVLDSATPLDGITAVLCGDVTYTGCGRCSAELSTDTNGIYTPCYPCLPHTAVRRYYRPGVLTVSGRDSGQLQVQVPPVSLQKILDAPPDRLQRSSGPGSEVKNIQVAAERIQTLLSLPRKTVVITLRSHFLCDENSVPISQDFTLLDLRFPS
ncbi:shieldin complex subunit 2 [Xenentodon cancila]